LITGSPLSRSRRASSFSAKVGEAAIDLANLLMLIFGFFSCIVSSGLTSLNGFSKNFELIREFFWIRN
jgi:hypothetical protein